MVTSKLIWSENFDRSNNDLITIIDGSAQSIASAMKIELSIEELEDIKVTYDVDPEAHEYYLKGVHYHWNKYLYGRGDEDLRQSEKMFINAISIDSTYAEAYAGLAD